jgi:8-oxo-dGTP pyrophosphatase MutT (NUDIX family)
LQPGSINNQTLPEEVIALRLRQANPNGKASFTELQAINGGGRCAAVLIPFVHADDGWHLLFIRRTDTVQDHKGQVAFPGGGCEIIDGDLEGTSLRETEEEIGIPANAICILGRLPSLLTVSDFLVTPIVGTIHWPYPMKISQEEVSRVFSIPLAWLSDPSNREERLYLRNGEEHMVTFFHPYDGETLWGASAKMVLILLHVLGLD